MNAIEFVKQNGIEKAKQIVDAFEWAESSEDWVVLRMSTCRGLKIMNVYLG